MGAGDRSQPLQIGRGPISQAVGSHVAYSAEQQHAAPASIPPSGEGELQLLLPWRDPLGSPHSAPSWVLLACAKP